MHMTDALLSPAVGVAMCAISVVANSYAVKKIKKDDICEKKIPIMGVMGAFVFAAQMINFTIPGTGSSGHIGGGILLASMIGGFPALISMSAVLVIQCLFFADGGLLALGCNIFNIGVIPCLIIYPLIFKPIVKKGITFSRITAASIIAVVISLQLGAFCVVLETICSGAINLPFSTFAILMQLIHLAIGIGEGIITAAILCFVYNFRPEIMESTFERKAIQKSVSMRNILVLFTVITLFIGGVLSIFASSNPDGLEWALSKVMDTIEPEPTGSVIEGITSVQEKTTLMPDYDFKEAKGEGTGTAVAGIVGGAITFLIAGASAGIIFIVKKKHKNKASKVRLSS